MEAFAVVVAVGALLGHAAVAAWLFESGATSAVALRRSMRRRSAWAVAVPVAGAALALGVPFLYIQLTEDPEPPLQFSDAPAVTSSSSSTSTSMRRVPSTGTLATGTTTVTTFPTSPVDDLLLDEAPGDTAGPSTTAPRSEVSGGWRAGEGSIAGYRVDEILLIQNKTTVGRTSNVTGEMLIDDLTVRETRFSVDMASVTSDSAQRDEQYRGRIMNTDAYPTSDFVLTEPIVLERIPAEDEVLELSATGDFTIHGTTRSVTFPIQARRHGGRIEVLGSIPVRWDEYGIPEPGNGFVQVEDHGLIEFLLLFDRAA